MSSSKGTVIYPLSFPITHTGYVGNMNHLMKQNPGSTIDFTDGVAPIVMPACKCGEKIDIVREDNIDEMVRYRCLKCKSDTGYQEDRQAALQAWVVLQTN